MTLDESSDENLIKQYVDTDDDKFFHLLYQRYVPLMYGLCLKYLKDEQEAKDTVVFLYEDILKKVKKYEIINFKNWLYSVTKFQCFSILKEKKKEMIVDFNDNIVEFDTYDTLLEEQELDEEKLQALNTCIDKLPEPQKLCVIAFYLNDRSYAEIVDETLYNIKSVKSYIQNGKRNLKICLEKNNQL